MNGVIAFSSCIAREEYPAIWLFFRNFRRQTAFASVAPSSPTAFLVGVGWSHWIGSKTEKLQDSTANRLCKVVVLWRRLLVVLSLPEGGGGVQLPPVCRGDQATGWRTPGSRGGDVRAFEADLGHPFGNARTRELVSGHSELN
jgi:hypothetical protein